MRSRTAWLFVALFAVAMPSHAYRMSAWVPSWDTKALTSMQLNAGKLDEANPGWYTIAADGTFTRNANAEAADLRAALAGVDLVPTIKNYVNGRFDGTLVANIVGSPDLREKHAEALTRLVVESAYAGIDIDYENLSATTKSNFTLFVQLLAQKLHGANKTLSVTVSAKTSDNDNWSGPAGEDWRAIGAAADTVKIMAYDNHWSGSAAGAIAPLNWLDNIATYAEATIPAGKIIIGLPWYGYDWQGTSATDLVYSDAIALAQKNGAQVGYDINGEATFAYNGRTVYFQDASSYAKKTDAILRKHPHIGGFAHWRAGGEDPRIWATVALLHQSSSAPATPAGSFVVSGPLAMSVKGGQPSQVTLSLVPVDGWTGTANVSVQQLDAFPGNVTVSQTASNVTPALLRVTPDGSARAGQYRLRVTATSGTLSSSITVTVTVQAPAGKRRSASH